MLFVTEDNPRLLDEQFVDEYPALGLRSTANSGAFHGDGDLRAEAVDYNRILFALESKARFSEKHKHCRPYAGEWVKAMEQLTKFHGQVTRLFLVFNAILSEWSISIPAQDAARLEAYGFTIGGTHKTLRPRTGIIRYRYLSESQWNTLYEQIEAFPGLSSPKTR